VKFEIQQEEFQKALDLVVNVVPAKTPMPILTCVLMEIVGDRLSLSATNLENSIVTSTDQITVKTEGKIAVPAGKLVPFVRSLRPGKVSVSTKDQDIQVVGGKTRLTEKTMKADEYPALKPLKEKNGFAVDGRILVDMINDTSYAVSRDETRPALMGILWEIRATELNLVATDAHRLALSKKAMSWDAPGDKDLIVRTSGLRHLPKIVAAMAENDEGGHPITIFMSDNQLSFLCGDTILHVQILEGPFPDYHAVIPSDNDKDLTVDKASLIQAIRRVSITADRMSSQIRLGIEAGRMELSARGTDGSQSEDELEISYDGEPLEIGFNYTYLVDILKNIRTESVTLSLRDAQSAALLRPVGDAGEETGVLCLLMPLRLAGE